MRTGGSPIRNPPMALTGFDGIISRRQSLDDQRTSKSLVDSVDASKLGRLILEVLGKRILGSSNII